MRSSSRFLAVGLGFYTIAWFVQVIAGGATLADGILPRWQAFRVALSPIWPYDNFHLDGWLRRSLSVASAFTNAIALALPLWLRLVQARRTAFAVGPLCLAAAIDAHWMYPDLLCWGYYMWFGSFITLAVGVARATPRILPLGSSAA